jgi:hypothetical protein
MRHIPEEELHAYLDQALSRSQCVEIECHLAGCVRCRHERDQIAAVRDRTTALLGLVAPAGRRRPLYAELALQARGRQADPTASTEGTLPRSRGWVRTGSRAAGVALAIAAGWGARDLLAPEPFTGSPSALQQLVIGPGFSGLGIGQPPLGSVLPVADQPEAQTEAVQLQPDPDWRPDPIERTASRREVVVSESAVTPLALTVSTLDASEAAGDFPSGGVWRSVSWSEAAALTGDAIPRIEGMPVVEIQVQPVGPEERPVIMVAHQDAHGRIIRSIEGPAERLAQMLAEVIDRTDGAMRTSQPSRTTLDYISSGSGTPRRSLRVVALAGRIAVDSLNALARSLVSR